MVTSQPAAHLPEELERAHKGARAHLPPVYVGPLVDQQRQVAVALHPPAHPVAAAEREQTPRTMVEKAHIN